MSEFYEKYWDHDSESLGDFSLKWPKLSGFIPREPGVSILDFGCGKGEILGAIKKLNPEAKLTGLDVSKTAIDFSTKNHPGIVFHAIEDGGKFPLADNSIDFVFTSEVIEHVYDTENAFREIARVLKPGGKLLLTCPYHGFIKNLSIVLFGFDKHFDPTGPHVRFFSKKTLSRCLSAAGLVAERWGHYGRFYPVPHSIFVLAKKNMTPKLSLIVLTYNEELNLRKCLKSVEGLVSEIIIVDSGSTDGTKKIAEEFGAKFITHEFKNQAEQFNWALANTNPTGDWILRLDADEELLPELKKEIEEKLPNAGKEVGGFYLNRRNYFKGAWIKHGGYYPIWILRLFRKGAAKSEEREMDEHLVLLSGKAEKLRNDFIDNNLNGLEAWKEKHRKYAMREARAYLAHEDGKEVGGQAGEKRRLKLNVYYRVPSFLRVVLYFLYRYFILLGFLDGWNGTQFHFLQGFWYRWLIDRNILKLGREAKGA